MSNTEPDKTLGDLVTYCVKILERGDSYRDVNKYLKRNTEDPEVITKVLTVLREMDNQKKLEVKDDRQLTTSKEERILGFVAMGFGVFLITFLWKFGWVAVFPLALIIYGLRAVTPRAK